MPSRVSLATPRPPCAPRLPASCWFDAFDPTPDGPAFRAARQLRETHRRTRASAIRAFLVFVDGALCAPGVARSGRAAEARDRVVQRIATRQAERVRAVWVGAAPLADRATYLRSLGAVRGD